MATQAQNEASVRQLIERWLDAIRAKDLPRLMSLFAKDVVAYDMMPPLKYEGTAQYRRAWEIGFASTEGPFHVELRDLVVAAGDDVAFAHALEHVTVTLKDSKDGEPMEMWLRWTAGLRRSEGEWKIAHVQDSVPIDTQTNRGLMELEP